MHTLQVQFPRTAVLHCANPRFWQIRTYELSRATYRCSRSAWKTCFSVCMSIVCYDMHAIWLCWQEHVCAQCMVSLWNISIFRTTPSRSLYSTAHGQSEKRVFQYVWVLYVMTCTLYVYADRSMCVHGVWLAFELFWFFPQHPHAGCTALLTVSVKNVILCI
jgi:hypothetical protein